MGKYNVDTGVEGEYEPGSRGRVLRNLLGIRQVRVMDEAEYRALLRAQSRYLRIIHETTRFTSALLCRMHRDWLGGIYSWAGSYRSVEMTKGGFTWPPAHRVAENMAAFGSGLLRSCTPCSAATLEGVASQVAWVHAEFLLIHPFREGNGRLARWLADLMVAQAGLPSPDYGFEGRGAQKRRERYLNGVIAGYRQDYERLLIFT